MINKVVENAEAANAGISDTPAGVGTEVAEGKELREFYGKQYLMESWLKADHSLVKAWKGDTSGNLIYKGTARDLCYSTCIL
jgi:acyl CoA:acetate/3-ketoacid CoA transferase alpha subunit